MPQQKLSALFNREYKLLIGDPGKDGVVVTDLRVVFNSKANRKKSPNASTIKVYNLARSTSDRIATGQVAQLSAGYTGMVAPIITGDITRVENYVEGVDRVCEISVHDSMVSLRDSKTSLSFAPGTSARAILKAVGANFGLPIRANIIGEDRQIVAGYAFNGRTRNAFTEICDYLGLEWSAQQGEIQVMNKGIAYDTQGIILSADTGLIGYPKPKAQSISDKNAAKEGIKYGQDGIRRYTKTDPTAKVKDRVFFEQQGYTVESLMIPALYPGAYVNLKFNKIDKWFLADECTYAGDTHGPEWGISTELIMPKEITQK